MNVDKMIEKLDELLWSPKAMPEQRALYTEEMREILLAGKESTDKDNQFIKWFAQLSDKQESLERRVILIERALIRTEIEHEKRVAELEKSLSDHLSHYTKTIANIQRHTTHLNAMWWKKKLKYIKTLKF